MWDRYNYYSHMRYPASGWIFQGYASDLHLIYGHIVAQLCREDRNNSFELRKRQCCS